MPDLIKMTRATEDANGGPTEAEVHPDEVSNYAMGGWRLAEKPGGGTGDNNGRPLNVTQTVALVTAAMTIEELDKLAEGETRKGVLDAIAKRRAELAPAPGEITE